MSALEEAVAKDLAPLGQELCARATRYVVTGSDAGVLDVLDGHCKALRLKAVETSWMDHTREVLASFGEADGDPLERLGRVYAATTTKSFITELGGELRWVEHIVWEAGVAAPHSGALYEAGSGRVKLAWLDRRMTDAEPLVRAMLLLQKAKADIDIGLVNFTRNAFAHNAFSAPDLVDFLVRHKDLVAKTLRERDPHALERLDEAKVPVEPFVDALAELASDERVTVQRPAMKLLALSPAAARQALRSFAATARSKNKKLAEQALAMLPEEETSSAPSAQQSPLAVPPLSRRAKEKLRALCDEWHAHAVPKVAAHRATYPKADTRGWDAPVDDETLARVVAQVEHPAPWTNGRGGADAILARVASTWLVALPEERITETLSADFELVHIARLLELMGASRDEWLAARLIDVTAETRHPLEAAREAFRFAAGDPVMIDRAILVAGAYVEHPERIEYLERHQDVLEAAFGVRAATWMESREGDRWKAVGLGAVRHMKPERVGKPVVDAVWTIALAGGKTHRPLAQDALAHIGGFEERLVSSLGDRSAEVRANAATWMARIKLRSAREALRKALAKEKNNVARAALMEALEASGEPLDALMDRPGLLENARDTLAKIPCTVLEWPEVAALPALHFADTGEVVDASIVRAWIAEAYKLKNPAPSPMLRLYAPVLLEGEREELARVLLDAWIAHDTASQAEWDAANYTPMTSAVAEKGILAVVAAFGRPGITERVAKFLKTYYGMRAAQCKALLQMLAHVDDKAATQLLLATATRFRTAGIRAEAEKLAKELAERHGWTVDEMADHTIPTGGLDDDGKLRISYGAKRGFVVSLDASLRLALRTDDASPLKALPAAHKDEAEADVKAAKTQFSRAKKEIETVITMQRARLYEAMCTQRTWRYEDWSRLLARHPIASRLVGRVVWSARDDGVTLRPLDDGTLSTADHEGVELAPDATIRVAHPLTMSAGREVSAWLTHLSDFEVMPLFAQLSRKVTAVPPEDATSTEVTTYVGHMVEAFKLRGRATALGYVRGPAEDGGWFHEYGKLFPSLGLRVCLGFSGNSLPEENRTVALGAWSVEATPARKLALAKVPPILFSEVAADMEEIAQEGTGFDADWESKVG